MELPGKLDAPPTIWTTFIGFSTRKRDLVVEASKLLVAVDKGDQKAIDQLGAKTRKACSACHQQFRN